MTRRWLIGAATLAASLVIGLALGLSGEIAPWPVPAPATKLARMKPAADDDLIALASLVIPGEDDATDAADTAEEGEGP